MATSAALAKRDLERFWLTLDHSNMLAVRRELEWFYPALVSEYGNVAAVVAGDWYEQLYNEAAQLAALPEEARVNARMRWAIGAGFGGNPDQALSTLKVVTDELVKQMGRDTIMRSAINNGRRYARIPTGSETCAFCLMAASRGFIYRSADTAGEMAKFHGDCDCAIVPHDGTIPDGYDPDSLYAQYRSVHERFDDEKDVARKLRNKLGIN